MYILLSVFIGCTRADVCRCDGDVISVTQDMNLDGGKSVV